MSETTKEERDHLRIELRNGRAILVEQEPLYRVLYDLDRLAAIERDVRGLADEFDRRGLQGAKLIRAIVPEPDGTKRRLEAAPTDNGIPELDDLCERYNNGEIDLCSLVCKVWNKAIVQQP